MSSFNQEAKNRDSVIRTGSEGCVDVKAPRQGECGGHHWKSEEVRWGGKDIQSRGSARTKAPGGSILGMTKEGLGDRVARLRAETQQLGWSAGW